MIKKTLASVVVVAMTLTGTAFSFGSRCWKRGEGGYDQECLERNKSKEVKMTYAQRFKDRQNGIQYYSYKSHSKLTGQHAEKRPSYFHQGNLRTFKKDWRTVERKKFNWYHSVGQSLRGTVKQTRGLFRANPRRTYTESALYRKALLRRKQYKAFSKLYE